MITITIQGIEFNNNLIHLSGEECSITVAGHSGQAAKGNDIICAGVSALAQSVALALEYYAIAHSINQKDGLLEFCVKVCLLNDAEKTRCESIMSVFILGINEIRKQYPKFVKVYIKR
ncbi:MAG: ribosomal-processing cysteine protease Prp [Spirochaetes bacterium]|nr:ribosomal-processing cysteine protease Prp [Spirochaetota bacterium]